MDLIVFEDYYSTFLLSIIKMINRSIFKKIKGNIFILILLLTRLLTSNQALANEPLLVGAIPDQNPERLNRLYDLLCLELSEKIKIPVRYVPVTNYSAAVSAFRTKSLDLVWFGGLTGVQARLQTPGSKVLAQRDIDEKFRSVFVANKSSGIPIINNIYELKYLKNRRFTFGSESSTSGRLMPQYFLQQAGVQIDDFSGRRPGFSGSHDSTIALVQSGSYEAGALNEQVWNSSVSNGRADLDKIRVIWRTPKYKDYHWLAQQDLDKRYGKGFTKKLQKTLIDFNMENPRQAKILNLFGAKRFIPASNDQYKEIEIIGRQLGKIN